MSNIMKTPSEEYFNTTLRDFFETCANNSSTAELADRLPDHLFKRSLTSPDEKFSLSRFVYSNRNPEKLFEKKIDFVPLPNRKLQSRKTHGDAQEHGMGKDSTASDNQKLETSQPQVNDCMSDEDKVDLYQQLLQQCKHQENQCAVKQDYQCMANRTRRLMLDFQTRRSLQCQRDHLVLPASVIHGEDIPGLQGNIIHMKRPANQIKTFLVKEKRVFGNKDKSTEGCITGFYRAKTQGNFLNTTNSTLQKSRLIIPLERATVETSVISATRSNINNINTRVLPETRDSHSISGRSSESGGGSGNGGGGGSGFRPKTVPTSFFSKHRQRYGLHQSESSRAGSARRPERSLTVSSSFRTPRRPSTSFVGVRTPQSPTQALERQNLREEIQYRNSPTELDESRQVQSETPSSERDDLTPTPKSVVSLNVFLPREAEEIDAKNFGKPPKTKDKKESKSCQCDGDHIISNQKDSVILLEDNADKCLIHQEEKCENKSGVFSTGLRKVDNIEEFSSETQQCCFRSVPVVCPGMVTSRSEPCVKKSVK